jgi:predicted regulator of Ras-like GTPase activity (Roadblock/LC7/MglB family)
MAVPESTKEATGFHGDVAGLSLADVIQLNGNNGFSGCITVQQGSEAGRIFFRDGRIVHAEQGGKSGEAAFYEIMEWSSGHFSLAPNVSTTSHTIQKSTQFVLMEAHRLIDERRAGHLPPPPAEPEASGDVAAPPSTGTLLKAVAGVERAVQLGKDGVSLDGGSPEDEVLAGEAAYLAVMANRIGASLGAGEVRSIAVRRAAGHLLVLAARTGYLGVLVDARREPAAAEAEIRKLLGPSP